jgi:hypothetical protein
MSLRNGILKTRKNIPETVDVCCTCVIICIVRENETKDQTR